MKATASAKEKHQDDNQSMMLAQAARARNDEVGP